MSTESLALTFSAMGGNFILPAIEIANKLKNIKAFVFDWDGVFNNASKNRNKSSTFNEADSMGTNLLRFSHYLINQNLPVTAIISGENNEMAMYFCNREHYNAAYSKIANKVEALTHLCQKHNLHANQVCYVFDDVLDLSIANVCGLRFLVNRKANPLFINYCKANNLADYITHAESGNFAVREVCELLIGLNQNYNEVITARMNFNDAYKTYLNKRQQTPTSIYTYANGIITETEN